MIRTLTACVTAVALAIPALTGIASAQGKDMAPAVYDLPPLGSPQPAPGAPAAVQPSAPQPQVLRAVPGNGGDIAVLQAPTAPSDPQEPFQAQAPLSFNYASFCSQPARDGSPRSAGWVSACMASQKEKDPAAQPTQGASAR